MNLINTYVLSYSVAYKLHKQYYIVIVHHKHNIFNTKTITFF